MKQKCKSRYGNRLGVEFGGEVNLVRLALRRVRFYYPATGIGSARRHCIFTVKTRIRDAKTIEKHALGQNLEPRQIYHRDMIVMSVLGLVVVVHTNSFVSNSLRLRGKSLAW